MIRSCIALLLVGWLAAASPVVAAEAILRIGDSKGLYKALLTAAGELEQVPYRVEWAEFPATAPALEALAAGAIDLRLSAAAPLIFALAGGAPVKAVATLRLDGPRESVAILVPAASPIHVLADLRGKRVGTNKGSVGHHLLLAALQRDHIPFDQVTIRYLLPAEAKAALEGGSVDAWSTWDPYVSIAEVQDRMRPVVDGTGLPITDGVIVASKEALADKRGLLADFVARQARAQHWALDHQQAYARLYATLTGLEFDTAAQVVRHMNYGILPIDQATIRDHQEVADLYLKAGVIPQRVDVAGAFDVSLYR
jgi:sulfonate transport system substrate-binding protein